MPHELEWLHTWDHRPTAVVMVRYVSGHVWPPVFTCVQPVALAYIRGLDNTSANVHAMVTRADEVVGTDGSTSRVQALSDATAKLAASDYKVMQINLRISTYSDTIAACERLYKQPIPTGVHQACPCPVVPAL